MLGSTEPRLWTPPLRELTPDTSYGFDVIEFARDVLGQPLDPWEEWVVIHAGELLPDGRPRFRELLILVARQNGKTFLLVVLALYWLFVELQALVLGMSTTADYAKEAWQKAVDLAEATPELAAEIPARGVRTVNGDVTLTNSSGCRYKIAAANRRGGRSLTVNRLIIDELREHRDFVAWDAATNATNAVRDAQVFTITNQGDNDAVVLDALRTPALEYLETAKGDYRLGLFEYSAPQGADPTDLAALAMANPNLGRRIDPDALLGKAMRAKAAGGEELAGFKTENMCMRVHLLDPAIDPDWWALSGREKPLQLSRHRDTLALCMDISLDGTHAALVAAALVDGVHHLEVIEAWEGYGCTKQLRAELPALVRRVRPRALGWFPAGPAAAVAADLRTMALPKSVALEEFKADAATLCMGFADLVTAGEVRHPNDPMLTAHSQAAQKLWHGDVWVFTRRGKTGVDGMYASAGAVHLVRMLPPPRPPLVAV